jgi:pyruvate/2-oxoacid:ferredoxin oxidoreductase beta subunit
MTNNKILSKAKMPFCQGCGHGIIVRSIAKAMEELGYTKHDTIIVSDIGCSGLVDPLFDTHSIHGLHGRAPALGVGVSLGLDNTDKKVIIIQGDGGVTIGLQHVLEAARRNIDVTLVVMNNLLYGMTGGQISGLSTQKFKEQKNFEVDVPPFDIVKLAHASGAAFSARATSIKTYTDVLKEGIEVNGFSIIEFSSLCTSYAFKKLDELQEVFEEAEVYKNERIAVRAHHKDTNSLLDRLQRIDAKFDSKIEKSIGVVLAGSAGGGVQSAAKLLATAGMFSGLHATMKGEYPVTVGTGFSIAEVILSTDPVQYTGLENPEVVIIVSDDGWNKVKNKITDNSIVIIDNSLKNEETESLKNKVIYGDFNRKAGKRGAALAALAYWISDTKTMDIEALKESVSSHKYSSVLLKAIEAGLEI